MKKLVMFVACVMMIACPVACSCQESGDATSTDTEAVSSVTTDVSTVGEVVDEETAVE